MANKNSTVARLIRKEDEQRTHTLLQPDCQKSWEEQGSSERKWHTKLLWPMCWGGRRGGTLEHTDISSYIFLTCERKTKMQNSLWWYGGTKHAVKQTKHRPMFTARYVLSYLDSGIADVPKWTRCFSGKHQAINSYKFLWKGSEASSLRRTTKI